MSSTFDDQDGELNKLIDEFEDDIDAVDIGLLASEDSTLLIIGAANEFGTRNGHIPERSFIRAGVDMNASQIMTISERQWGLIVDGRITKRAGLERMGEEIQRHITRRITDIKIPPNALSTIQRKGSDNPLIDTGRLRSSIRWVLASSKEGEAGI